MEFFRSLMLDFRIWIFTSAEVQVIILFLFRMVVLNLILLV